MQIQVNTGNHVSGGERLNRQAEAAVHDALGHYADRITRVEVHLSDENSASKAGGADKRCVMEARVRNLAPITVSDKAESIEQALGGAGAKLARALSKKFGQLGESH